MPDERARKAAEEEYLTWFRDVVFAVRDSENTADLERALRPLYDSVILRHYRAAPTPNPTLEADLLDEILKTLGQELSCGPNVYEIRQAISALKDRAVHVFTLRSKAIGRVEDLLQAQVIEPRAGAQTTESTPPTPWKSRFDFPEKDGEYLVYVEDDNRAEYRIGSFHRQTKDVGHWHPAWGIKGWQPLPVWTGAAQTPGETCPDPDQFCIGDSGRSPAPAPQKEICDCCDETLESCRCGCTHDPD